MKILIILFYEFKLFSCRKWIVEMEVYYSIIVIYAMYFIQDWTVSYSYSLTVKWKDSRNRVIVMAVLGF